MRMSKRKRSRAAARAEPQKKRCMTFFCDSTQFGSLKCRGYTTLAENPETATAVVTIARLGWQTAAQLPPGMCAVVKVVPFLHNASRLGVIIS